jgi:hypothetical protein
METFAKLFGSLLALVYHCFDRIVILGHLPLLTRPENFVHFFRDIHQVETINKEILRQRTDDYHRWVDAFANKRKIAMEWAEKGVRKEDYVRPHLRRMERRNQFGVYFILKSMELGPSFRSAVPRFPVADPHYRILARQRSRYTHYYFYIRDEMLGPIALCIVLALLHHLLPQRPFFHRTRNSCVPVYPFVKTTTPFSGSPTKPPYRLPPTVSAPRSFASSSITGLGS